MGYYEKPRIFESGIIVATPGVLESIPRDEWLAALNRHLSCDWGDVCSADAHYNDVALLHGERLISRYYDLRGYPFWIISEADRSATTLLLPSEY